jgi:hypothetical protein
MVLLFLQAQNALKRKRVSQKRGAKTRTRKDSGGELTEDDPI